LRVRRGRAPIGYSPTDGRADALRSRAVGRLASSTPGAGEPKRRARRGRKFHRHDGGNPQPSPGGDGSEDQRSRRVLFASRVPGGAAARSAGVVSVSGARASGGARGGGGEVATADLHG